MNARPPRDAPLLAVTELRVEFPLDRKRRVVAVDGVSFELRAGERLGIVGESGSGKTVTALAIMRLLAPPGRIAGGHVVFRGRDMSTLSRRELEDVRGRHIGMVFQDPITSLDPLFRVGDQVAEAVRRHDPGVRRTAARARAIDLLREVGIPSPAKTGRRYPHELSGGMRQRVMIAGALASDPALLIADEPTTALDVTVQAQIVELLDRLAADLNMSVILITHDLGVVAGFAQRVLVMYAGRAVEDAPVEEVFAAPSHPYTAGLLASVTRLDRPVDVDLPAIPGAPPDLASLPAGCAFAPRCPRAADRCREEAPALVGEPHPVACFFPLARPVAR